MKKDEFNLRPSEFSKTPKEVNNHDKEFNEDYGKRRLALKTDNKKQAEEEKAKAMRRKLVSYMTGACVGVSVVTSSAGFNMFGLGRADDEAYKYQFDTYYSAYVEEKEDTQLGVLLSGSQKSLGAVWSEEPVEIADGLTLSFDYLASAGMTPNLPEEDIPDGLCVNFVSSASPDFQNAHTGGEFGYIGDFGVEIDFFGNPQGEIRGTKDYKRDHVAVIDSEMNHLAGMENLTISGRKWYHVTVELVPKNDEERLLKTYINGDCLAESVVRAASDTVMIGISAANGDCHGWAYISDLRINSGKVKLTGTDKTDSGDNLSKLADINCLPPNLGGTLNDYGAYGILKHISYSDIDANESVTGFDEKDKIQVDDINDNNDVRSDKTNSDENAETDEPTAEKVTEKRICETCNGTGIICPGSIAADDPEGCHGEVYVHCKACNETGKESDGSPCNWCKGTLTHMCPSFENHRTCEYCNGTGYIEE